MSHDTAATLRVISTVRSTEDITAILGMRPSESFNRGDVVRSRGRTDGQVRGHTLWALESDLPRSAELSDHLLRLADFLEARATAIAVLKKDCDLDIFCFFGSENGQGGIILSGELMRRLGTLGVDVVLDLYVDYAVENGAGAG